MPAVISRQSISLTTNVRDFFANSVAFQDAEARLFFGAIFDIIIQCKRFHLFLSQYSGRTTLKLLMPTRTSGGLL